MKNALIDPINLIEGYPSVVSVSDTPFETVPEYYWVECPDDTVSGMYYNNGTFVLPLPPAPPVPTAEENKARAINKLKNTDWVECSSVTDPSSTPYLLNKDDFITFRNSIRSIAVNPQEGLIQWPNYPKANWSN